jgi:hypothetical protein
MIEYLRLVLYKQIILAQQGKCSKSYKTTNLRNNAYEYVTPHKIHFDIIVKIFKLNLCLYYFDGSIGWNKQNKFDSGKQYFYSKDKSTRTLNLFYNLNHYSKFYEEKEYREHAEILRAPLEKLKDTIFCEAKYNCKDCNCNTDLVIFERQEKKVCKKCLRGMVDKVLFERALYLDLESYISRECKK